MFRKTTIALCSALLLATPATSAFAHGGGWGGHGGGWGGHGGGWRGHFGHGYWRYGHGYGYGDGWCYWRPYLCGY